MLLPSQDFLHLDFSNEDRHRPLLRLLFPKQDDTLSLKFFLEKLEKNLSYLDRVLTNYFKAILLRRDSTPISPLLNSSTSSTLLSKSYISLLCLSIPSVSKAKVLQNIYCSSRRGIKNMEQAKLAIQQGKFKIKF